MVDFIESYNGRAILGISNKKAIEFVAQKKLVHATNSDAHSKRGIGKVYNLISAAPTKETLVSLLESAEHITGRAPLAEYLSPTLNRLSKRFK
jgi:predicted metal-dependent phosphoesterase TrpH